MKEHHIQLSSHTRKTGVLKRITSRFFRNISLVYEFILRSKTARSRRILLPTAQDFVALLNIVSFLNGSGSGLTCAVSPVFKFPDGVKPNNTVIKKWKEPAPVMIQKTRDNFSPFPLLFRLYIGVGEFSTGIQNVAPMIVPACCDIQGHFMSGSLTSARNNRISHSHGTPRGKIATYGGEDHRRN